jgi:mono/diheme cytochrome c family protein
MRRSAIDVLLLVLIAACVAAATAARADDATIKRGEYLARAGDCVACHSAPGGQPFAGGLRLDTPYGPIYSPNLTPDKDTGIGAWSDDEFYRALHEGIDREGHYLYPAFPFPWYSKVTREDALAIKAYLFAQKPVHQENKPPGLSFPYDVREALAAWRLLYFRAAEPKAPAPGDKLARGAYLVEGLGHCGECHNGDPVRGASASSGRYEGGAISGWYAPNITGDAKQGIGEWSEDDLAQYLKTGAAKGHGVALGPMVETIKDSLSHLNDDDLHAIAAYLKSIPPKQTFANTEGAFDRKGAPGEQVYLAHCASCHRPDGRGEPGRVPALAGNGAVKAGGPEDVIRVVLGGLPPAHGLGPMPAVGASLSDQEIAEVADYVRNSFGNAAPATSDPTKIAAMRKSVATPMAPAGPNDCAKVQSPEAQAFVADGGAAQLAQAQPIDRIGAVDAALAKLRPLADKSPDVAAADLTAAYCGAILRDGKASQPERARAIGEFAVIAYSEANHTPVKAK